MKEGRRVFRRVLVSNRLLRQREREFVTLTRRDLESSAAFRDVINVGVVEDIVRKIIVMKRDGNLVR